MKKYEKILVTNVYVNLSLVHKSNILFSIFWSTDFMYRLLFLCNKTKNTGRFALWRNKNDSKMYPTYSNATIVLYFYNNGWVNPLKREYYVTCSTLRPYQQKTIARNELTLYTNRYKNVVHQDQFCSTLKWVFNCFYWNFL